jgi:hypothetical protein
MLSSFASETSATQYLLYKCVYSKFELLILTNIWQRLQNGAVRVITGDTYEIRSTDILKKLNWKTLEERSKEQKLAYVAKALSNQCHENVSTMFKISNSDKYNLRSNNKMLMLLKPKSNLMLLKPKSRGHSETAYLRPLLGSEKSANYRVYKKNATSEFSKS